MTAPDQWPPYQQGYYYVPQPPPPRKSKRGLIIGLVVALVALLGGGATWIALSQSRSGADTPTAAALSLATSIGNGDVVGLLNTLAPAEAALFTEPIEDVTGELKRLKILDPNADPKALTGITVKAENLVFDEAQAERVNDHLTITKLVGGTITVTGDESKLPLAKEFLDAAGEEPEPGEQTDTTDIAEQVRESGEPIRIATVRVDGEWYPSVLYTIADQALLDAHEPWPSTSIPASGAASANDAVKELLQAALDADVRRVIELLPPDEMGALHDAGPALLSATGLGVEDSTGAKVLDLRTQTSSAAGATRVTLTSLEIEDPSGETISVTKNGDCYKMTAEGRTQQFCAADLTAQLEDEIGGAVPDEAQRVIENLITGVLGQGFGVITTQVNGKHYVSPIRTLVEQGMTVLRSLQADDITALLRLIK